jgi:peptidoglycan pentaglycine glycine transferase (the first glycine)
MPEFTSAEWDAFLAQFPHAHLLQSPAWGELKSSFGWKAVFLGVPGGESEGGPVGAQILLRRLPLGFSIAYIPKGPLGAYPWNNLWPEIDKICRQERAIFIKVEPDMWEENGNSTPPAGFQPSRHTIQPPRTLIVDLSGDEEHVLGRMRQKTRYNIKLALKKGVVVHPTADLDSFYRLMQITAGRDGFAVHSLEYYRKVYEIFHGRGACELLLAVYEDEPLAGLMVFAQSQRAWYLFGASGSDHRDRMPTYLLQWEAIRWARSRGCLEYDLWGVPDEDEETLEANFTERGEGLWGVYRNKRGFGGKLCRAAGPWDRVYQPFLYQLYQLWATKARD